jgi:hypothetical protein
MAEAPLLPAVILATALAFAIALVDYCLPLCCLCCHFLSYLPPLLPWSLCLHRCPPLTLAVALAAVAVAVAVPVVIAVAIAVAVAVAVAVAIAIADAVAVAVAIAVAVTIAVAVAVAVAVAIPVPVAIAVAVAITVTIAVAIFVTAFGFAISLVDCCVPLCLLHLAKLSARKIRCWEGGRVLRERKSGRAVSVMKAYPWIL